MYTVYANSPSSLLAPWDFRAGYFPRKVHYLKEAQNLAAEAILKGGKEVRIVGKDGKERKIPQYHGIKGGKSFPVQEEGMPLKRKLTEATGTAIQALYNLDIYLSNSFTGVPDSENDRGVSALHNRVRLAMDCLRLPELFNLVDGKPNIYHISRGNLVLTTDGAGNADMEGELQEHENDCEGERQFNLVMEGVERFLASLAGAGVPVDSPPVMEALQTVHEAAGNAYSWDDDE